MILNTFLMEICFILTGLENFVTRHKLDLAQNFG